MQTIENSNTNNTPTAGYDLWYMILVAVVAVLAGNFISWESAVTASEIDLTFTSSTILVSATKNEEREFKKLERESQVFDADAFDQETSQLEVELQ